MNALRRASDAVRGRALGAWLGALLGAAPGCRSDSTPPAEQAPPAREPRASQGALRPSAAPETAAPFARSALCRVDHGGLFVDLGTAASHARRSFALGPFTDIASDTWSDQSYTRFDAARVDYDFWLREPLDELTLRVRARAGSSGALAVSIDQSRLGSVRVRDDAFQTLTFQRPRQPLGPGRHELGLRWMGRPPSDGRPLGMIEWIHWAEPGAARPDYRPPRERGLRDDVVLGGVPRRAIVLETPGSVSCPVLVARDASLRLAVGWHGEGAGVARVIARRDGAPERLLAERAVSGPPGSWTELELPLGPHVSQLTHLELQARSDGSSGRLAFGEPEVVAAPAPGELPRARLAILIVASGLHRRLLPPFEGSRRLRHISALAARSVRFPEYRAPTTLVGAVLATVLSALPPLAHGLAAPRARLPREVLLLGERLREESGESAFFTGVPHTRAAFGFDRGWQEYEQLSPVSDVAASAPLEHARAWLEAALRRDRDVPRLLVVHMRGGHPPWDLSQEEVQALEPSDYLGLLEARRGGLILAGLREHPRPSQRRLSAADWARLTALQLAALAKQDAALGELVELLEREQLYDDTLLAFAGDVAMGEPPEVPFGDAGPLTEDRLVVPLWIKFPGRDLAGSASPVPVGARDLGTTLARSLGIELPRELASVDLWALARGHGPALSSGVLSTLGQSYTFRHGAWLLRGTSPRRPTLCEIAVDPACVHDVLERSPLAAEALWRSTFEAHRSERAVALGAPAPAPLDKDTAAALKVWGD